jgi:hypothetical protein
MNEQAQQVPTRLFTCDVHIKLQMPLVLLLLLLLVVARHARQCTKHVTTSLQLMWPTLVLLLLLLLLWVGCSSGGSGSTC